MSTGEIWRDVPGVPGVLASSEGRVMITPYRGPMPNGGQRPYGGTPTFGVWNKTDGRFVTTWASGPGRSRGLSQKHSTGRLLLKAPW